MSQLIKLDKVSKTFPEPYTRLADFVMRRRNYIKAVNDVTLSIGHNTTLGLVGESGSGKTTLGRLAIRLLEPDSGRIIFRNTDITHLPEKRLRPLRRYMQIIYQDPYSSLNPAMRIGRIIAQTAEAHRISLSDDDIRELLKSVGLRPDDINKYPHQLSGGQRQRVAIARAVALKPDFIVADEITSSLDVSIQAQILKLLTQLKEELNLSILFISHDLSVISEISDEVAVLYRGQIVEEASKDRIFKEPSHPYTQMLLKAIPLPSLNSEWNPPELRDEHDSGRTNVPMNGCVFYPRCPLAKPECRTTKPKLTNIGEGHYVACLLYE